MDKKDRYVRVSELPDFVKDTKTNALINTNKSALEQYKAQKKSREKMMALEDKVESLSSDVKEIKQLLQGLVNNG